MRMDKIRRKIKIKGEEIKYREILCVIMKEKILSLVRVKVRSLFNLRIRE
jgi:hypothetical protein